MSRTVTSTPIMLLLALTATSGYADITLKYSSEASSEPNTVMVSGDKVRTESTNPRGKNMSIYDNKKKTLTLIDHQQKSYVVMDNDAIDKQAHRIHEMQKKALAEMQQQLQKMSPEQRQLMEQKMVTMGIAGIQSNQGSARFSTNRTNRSETVNGIRCEVYESFQNKEKIGEACIAGPNALRISSSDYQTLQGLFTFLRSMTKRFASGGTPSAGTEMSMFDNVEGLPVKMANTQGDTMILEDITNQALPTDLFNVPSGYKLADMSEPDKLDGSSSPRNTSDASNPSKRPSAGGGYGGNPRGYRGPYGQRGYGSPYPPPSPQGYPRY